MQILHVLETQSFTNVRHSLTSWHRTIPSVTSYKQYSDHTNDPPWMAKHQNVIKVNDNTGIKQIKNNLIYHPLKHTWGIHKPKWYKKVLKHTISTRKNYFVSFFLAIGTWKYPSLRPKCEKHVCFLTRKVAPQYVEIGWSLKLCFFPKHDNQQ